MQAGYNDTICADPDSHIFWDLVHPTGSVHRLLAQDFATTFADQLSTYGSPFPVLATLGSSQS